MKSKNLLVSLTAVTLSLVGLIGCATEKEHGAARAAQAKITRAAAEQTALSNVSGGTIQDAELEKEQGKLIWSIDIAIPGSKDIREVAVDAVTGQVLSVETETPEQQAKEKEEDEQEKK